MVPIMKTLMLAIGMLMLATLPAEAAEGGCTHDGVKLEMSGWLQAELGLDADTAGLVNAVLADAMLESRRLRAERHGAFLTLTALVDARRADPVTLQEAMDSHTAAQEALVSQRRAQDDALAGLLDATQFARLQVALHRLHRPGHTTPPAVEAISVP